MAFLKLRELVFLVPLVPLCIGCAPPHEPAPPLPPVPAPGIARTPEEEWAPWEGQPLPESRATTEPPGEVAPSNPGVPPWQKHGGPLPLLPNERPRAEEPTTTEAVGRWIHSDAYGSLWVPGSASTTDVDGVPYTYLYTPRFGWTWYVSPWGWGAYSYGGWVARPWRPVGWGARPWVAHPRVVVRLGGGHRRRR